MKIGLLSDSHGRVEVTALAAGLLIERGAELLLHLGDIGSPCVLEALAGAARRPGRNAVPVQVVFGNVDLEQELLRRRARALGITVEHPVGRLSIEGRTLVFQHGHSGKDMERALGDGVDYLCHGHTHRPRDERIGHTRVINPGALHRATSYTAAILEVPADRLAVLTIPRALTATAGPPGTRSGRRTPLG